MEEKYYDVFADHYPSNSVGLSISKSNQSTNRKLITSKLCSEMKDNVKSL